MRALSMAHGGLSPCLVIIALQMGAKTATFGAGRPQKVEEAFSKLEGVISTRIGYMGGTVPDPSQRDVNTGATGHAHVVQVGYDPSQITYPELLDAFWKCHDPTQLNRQGSDIGNQYRSVIFSHDEEQQSAARQSRQSLQKKRPGNPIVTQIARSGEFFPALE